MPLDTTATRPKLPFWLADKAPLAIGLLRASADAL